MTNQTKEEQLFVRRINELAQTACFKDICTFTDFLTLNEISLFQRIEQELAPVSYSMSGGYPDAERKLICFHGGLEYKGRAGKSEELPLDFCYPISCLNLQPVSLKFSEHLTHRDYLGAILNLGIDRSKIGDLVITDSGAVLFCKDSIAKFLTEQFSYVRHTKVTATFTDLKETSFARSYETIHSTVSSVRLDAVIAAAFRVSRSKMTSVIAEGKVFLNGKETLNASHALNEGDIISVRGYGKVKYEMQGNLSKKGRINITLLKYS